MKISRGLVSAVALLIALGVAVPVWRTWQASAQMREIRANLMVAEPATVVRQLDPFAASATDSAELNYMLAIANRRSGHTSKARDYLALARRLGWSARDLKREQYLLQFQSGDTEQAEKHLLAMIGPGCTDDEAVEIYECLVMGYLSAMRLNDARVCLDYWLAWQPDSIVAHLLRAEIFRATRDRLREVAAYQAVLKVNPGHVRARRMLADAYLEVKDVPAALSNYEQCVELAPDDASLLVSVAACHRRLGNVAQARELLDRALKQSLPDAVRSFALTEQGQLAIDDKQYQRAVDLFQEATALAPVNSPAHYALGLALSRVGRQKEADWHIERSRKMDADATQYIDLVHEIMRYPENPELRAKAGEMALSEGARKEAFAWLQSALLCDPSHAETHRTLARYYSEAGHEDLAARHLAQADGETDSNAVPPR